MKTAIYAGTFDPVTYGHIEVIKRSLHLFDHIIIAIGTHHDKNPLFTVEERTQLITEALKGMKRVTIESFDGLLTDFAHHKKCSIIIKGLRAVSDFEMEFQQALTNRKIAEDIETVFVMTSQDYVYLSSSLVKEIAAHHGPLDPFVPKHVELQLRKKFR